MSGEARRRHGIDLVHVKLSDTAEAVTRILAEKAAGRTSGGSVDLLWVNGPNFVASKEQGLLSAPFATDLPNWRYVDTAHKPSNIVDFTVPVDGLEAPWRLAQLVFALGAPLLEPHPSWMTRIASEWERRTSQ